MNRISKNGKIMQSNIQKSPQDIKDWQPFWMIYVAGARPPRKKYHIFADVMKDADELCTLSRRKAFILSPIGIIMPPGSTSLTPEMKEAQPSTIKEDAVIYGTTKKPVEIPATKKTKKKVAKS